MARGPFQGTWQQGIRPTVVHSPDALVFINGELDILGCGQCRRRFDWNRWITSVQVDLSVDSSPGSASINMSVPRHSINEFYFDGQPLISPMMEIEIYAKGFFLVEGLPQYYPIFWGMTTEISDSYSGGEHSFSINCADILKWWELCKMNINPAFTAQSGQKGRSIFGNVFFGTNPYDIIWTCAQQAFGDVVVGSGSLISSSREKNNGGTFSRALADIMLYWNDRFSKIRSNLLLYGTQGTALRGDLIQAEFGKDTGIPGNRPKNYDPKKASYKVSKAVRRANGGNDGSQLIYDPTDPNVTAFRTQFMNAGQINFWQSEYQTKLELANAAKDSIGFEFFMDVTGDIVFKPPFYNLDILSNKPVSWIQDIDIIDWDLSESEGEVVTQVQISGSYGGGVDYGFGEEMTPHSTVTDYHLLRKYGWRTHQFNSEFMGSTKAMFEMGVDMLDRLNARRHRGTVNIPLRPELRLGFPIYLAPKDEVWYVNGISHNIAFGGRATTTLTLTAKRQKFIAPKGIGTLNFTGYKGPTPKAPKKGEKAKVPKPEGPITADRITARQLQRGGQFEVKVGEAAQIPPNNAPTKPDAENPYAPLILRHPKTGRLVGYPNVVMVYTRPFGVDFVKASASATPEKQIERMQGQRSQSSASAKRPGKEAALKQYNKEVNRQSGYQNDDTFRDKASQNRYSYGLTSAGAFVYLHDLKGVVKEVFTTKAASVVFPEEEESGDTSAKGKKIAAKAKAAREAQSGMIRPVSDERGFEVIGHWKYGRGMSLRDGSLIVNPGKENSKTGGDAPGGGRRVGETQLAIAGGLLDMLRAQSAGIGTFDSVSHPNPAAAITTLQPEPDLQTAGYINPDTKKPEFAPTNNNFVDSSPLGSATHEGGNLKPNIEATQLSRALTLTELSVLEDGGGAIKECACLLGRAELNFINVGYQLTTIRSTSEDTNTIPADGTTGFGALGTPVGDDFIEQAAAIEANIPLDNTAVSLTRGQLASRVEGFLTGLYKALDDSHQEVEAALRGSTLNKLDPTRVRDPAAIRFGEPPQQESGFAPPFSVPGRAAGGDPAALGQAGRSSRDTLEKEWDSFAERLKCQGAQTQFQLQLAQIDRQIAEIRAEIATLEAAVADGQTTIVGQGQSMESRIITLNDQLDGTGSVEPPGLLQRRDKIAQDKAVVDAQCAEFA